MPIQTTNGGGFGVPKMDEVCERLRIWYTFGIGVNSRLKTESDDLLAQAVEQYEQTHEPQRLFTALPYQTQTWDRARSVIIKAERREPIGGPSPSNPSADHDHPGEGEPPPRQTITSTPHRSAQRHE